MRLRLINIFHNVRDCRMRLLWLVTVTSGLSLLGLVALLFALDPPTAFSAPSAATAAPFASEPSWFAGDSNNTYRIAWGDLDGDGDLDLASGDQNGVRYYLNEGQALNPIVREMVGSGGLNARSISWGDADRDGDLDLAVGMETQGLYVYRNDATNFVGLQVVAGSVISPITSVAWGDMDGNGTLDLAIGSAPANLTGRIFVYTNTVTANGPGLVLAYTSTTTHTVQSLAWGDVDGDGDLDLAVGNKNGVNVIYKNESGLLSVTPAWQSITARDTRSIALGDIDGDGTLELVVGNYADQNQIYSGLGALLQAYSAPTPTQSVASVTFPLTDATTSVALADANGDGTLDLAVGNNNANNNNEPIYLYLSPSTYPSPTNLSLILNTSVTSLSATPTDVAWGDVNGDGFPDLAAARSTANAVFINRAALYACSCLPNAQEPGEWHVTSSVAWGDVDNDGDLDLARGMYTGIAPNLGLLLNTGGFLTNTAWNPQGVMTVTDIAWGDMNGDRLNDLAVATLGANYVYTNINGNLSALPAWQSTSISHTTSLAWGDVDGDGDLDLAVGNRTREQPQYSELYLNNAGTLSPQPAWTTPDALAVMDVAWGDVDGDGDPDLAVGSLWNGIKIYLNRNGQLATTVTDTIHLSSGGKVIGLAWGDVDGDGDLDLAVALDGASKKIYRNDNGRLDAVAWSSLDLDLSWDIEWADVDEDGDLDLVATYPHGVKVYRNLGETLERNAGTVWDNLPNSQEISIGDINQDGAIDIAVGSGNINSSIAVPDTILTRVRLPELFPAFGPNPRARTPAIYIDPGLARADGYATPQIHESREVPISYTLYIPTSAPTSTASIQAFYSLNGGGTWYTATATSETKTSHLLAFDNGQAVQHTFTWDVYASDFFGKSDNVVVRLVAQPNLRPQPNTAAGNYQWGQISARTFPFRVRGTQVRAIQAGAGIADALVYRISAGQKSGGVLTEETGSPLRTDNLGYLSGRGRLIQGDQLVALLPITQTPRYTFYHSSAEVATTGLVATTVITPGVILLDVSDSRPLMLFNLTVSLEWDARKDTIYLAQLEADIQRASELIFDATNGQVALGDVTIYHAGEQWEMADLRIHTTNRLRPHALIGGSVEVLTGVTLANPAVQLAFAPGHIEMPAKWNRFGESSGSLGEDWPRALAHEFGHYFFFLLEDYLGLDEAGRPVAVSTCPSLMGNVYLDENSEFHPAESWGAGNYTCYNTLQHQTLGRSDWETIISLYPWLNMPTTTYSNQNPGPSTLPIAVTRIRHISPTGPPLTLDVPAYYLIHPDGSRFSASSYARSFRFYGGNLSDLGEPRQDHLQAWGSQVEQGERVCVYDLNPTHPAVGCTTVQNGVSQLTMQHQPDWLPDIQISPVSTNTLAVRVGNIADTGSDLRIQIFDATRPLTSTPPTAVPLLYDTATGVYSATVPVHLSAYLRLWDENSPGREVVTDFTLSGAPGIQLGGVAQLRLGPGSSYTLNGETHLVPEGSTLVIGNGATLAIGNGTAEVLGDGATLAIGNGTTLAIGNGTTLAIGNGTTLAIGNGTTLAIGNGTALIIGNGATLAIGNGTTLAIGNGTTLAIGNGTAQLLADGNGPVLSSDGQVILYVDSLDFAPGQYFTLQPATRIPDPPLWATVVGQPYRLAASPGAPAIAGSSLSFRYLGRDVPPGEERLLKVFYHNPVTGNWQPLETTLDTVQNAAAAVAPGPGLYVLMSTIPIPLPTPGWNLISYPVQGSRSVTESLASIAGSYLAVYGYRTGDPQPWRFFSPLPGLADLFDMLHVFEFGQGYWLRTTEPVTLYLRGGGGEIRLADPRQTEAIPAPPVTLYGPVAGGPSEPGTPVQAWIDGRLCGVGRTGEWKGLPFYGLHIATQQEVSGCGQPGRTVTLALDGQMGQTRWAWQEGLHEVALTLSPQSQLFLPRVNR